MKINRKDFIGLGMAFAASGCSTWDGGFPAITAVRSPNGLLRHASIGTANMADGDIKSLRTHPKSEMAACRPRAASRSSGSGSTAAASRTTWRPRSSVRPPRSNVSSSRRPRRSVRTRARPSSAATAGSSSPTPKAPRSPSATTASP
ncbi:MAG: hypothetical protein IJ658_12425 [Kiritimatiellae bacterium]|nr:hypothetical protein [Kiritimatiellia bacterium]